MVIISGLNGYMFNSNITNDLFSLKNDILRHLRNIIEKQIYNDLNLDFNIDLGEMNDETFEMVTNCPLFKNWLNVNKTKYIILMKNDIILNDDNFKNIELKNNDIINYVIKPRF